MKTHSHHTFSLVWYFISIGFLLACTEENQLLREPALRVSEIDSLEVGKAFQLPIENRNQEFLLFSILEDEGLSQQNQAYSGIYVYPSKTSDQEIRFYLKVPESIVERSAYLMGVKDGFTLQISRASAPSKVIKSCRLFLKPPIVHYRSEEKPVFPFGSDLVTSEFDLPYFPESILNESSLVIAAAGSDPKGKSVASMEFLVLEDYELSNRLTIDLSFQNLSDLGLNEQNELKYDIYLMKDEHFYLKITELLLQPSFSIVQHSIQRASAFTVRVPRFMSKDSLDYLIETGKISMTIDNKKILLSSFSLDHKTLITLNFKLPEDMQQGLYGDIQLRINDEYLKMAGDNHLIYIY